MADLLALAGNMGSGAGKKKRLRSAQVLAAFDQKSGHFLCARLFDEGDSRFSSAQSART
jgi:hypothetical protein